MRLEGRRLEETALFGLHILYTTSKLGQLVTLLTCVQDVPEANIGRSPGYHNSGFFSSYSDLHANDDVYFAMVNKFLLLSTVNVASLNNKKLILKLYSTCTLLGLIKQNCMDVQRTRIRGILCLFGTLKVRYHF